MFDYYKAPSQEVFEEIKQKSIALWSTYDDEYGYATSKINRIKEIQNVKDNVWYIVGMFDQQNQSKLLGMLNEDSSNAMKEMLRWSYEQSF